MAHILSESGVVSNLCMKLYIDCNGSDGNMYMCVVSLCCAVLSVLLSGLADPDEVLSWKLQKDLKNHSNKLNGTSQAPPKPARSPQQQTTPPMASSGLCCAVCVLSSATPQTFAGYRVVGV